MMSNPGIVEHRPRGSDVIRTDPLRTGTVREVQGAATFSRGAVQIRIQSCFAPFQARLTGATPTVPKQFQVAES